MGSGFCTPACIAGYSCNNDSGRKGVQAGGKRIFVLSCSDRRLWMYSGNSSGSRGSPDPVSVFTLYRNQHSVAGRNRSFSWEIVCSGD